MLNLIKNIFFKNKPHSEWMVLEFLKDRLPENPVIIEAGAHEGFDTKRMSLIWPGGIIYAFEPIPMVLSVLKKNLDTIRNVRVIDLALSDQNAVSKMYVSTGRSNGSSSLLKPKDHLKIHPDVYFEEEITVQTILLKDFLDKNELKVIDFMWLDLQGMEFKVLSASSSILKSVGYIYCEVSLMETYEQVMKYPEFKLWMKSEGFEVVAEYLNWKDMGNVLFKNKHYIA